MYIQDLDLDLEELESRLYGQVFHSIPSESNISNLISISHPIEHDSNVSYQNVSINNLPPQKSRYWKGQSQLQVDINNDIVFSQTNCQEKQTIINNTIPINITQNYNEIAKQITIEKKQHKNKSAESQHYYKPIKIEPLHTVTKFKSEDAILTSDSDNDSDVQIVELEDEPIIVVESDSDSLDDKKECANSIKKVSIELNASIETTIHKEDNFLNDTLPFTNDIINGPVVVNKYTDNNTFYRDILCTPDSKNYSKNDLIKNDIHCDKPFVFNYGLQGSSLDLSEKFTKGTKTASVDLFKMESSCSGVGTPTKISYSTLNDTPKDIFQEDDLASFSNFITPQREDKKRKSSDYMKSLPLKILKLSDEKETQKFDKKDQNYEKKSQNSGKEIVILENENQKSGKETQKAGKGMQKSGEEIQNPKKEFPNSEKEIQNLEREIQNSEKDVQIIKFNTTVDVEDMDRNRLTELLERQEHIQKCLEPIYAQVNKFNKLEKVDDKYHLSLVKKQTYFYSLSKSIKRQIKTLNKKLRKSMPSSLSIQKKDYQNNLIVIRKLQMKKERIELHKKQLEGSLKRHKEKPTTKSEQRIAINKQNYENLKKNLIKIETRILDLLKKNDEYITDVNKTANRNTKISLKTLKDVEHIIDVNKAANRNTKISSKTHKNEDYIIDVNKAANRNTNISLKTHKDEEHIIDVNKVANTDTIFLIKTHKESTEEIERIKNEILIFGNKPTLREVPENYQINKYIVETLKEELETCCIKISTIEHKFKTMSSHGSRLKYLSIFCRPLLDYWIKKFKENEDRISFLNEKINELRLNPKQSYITYKSNQSYKSLYSQDLYQCNRFEDFLTKRIEFWTNESSNDKQNELKVEEETIQSDENTKSDNSISVTDQKELQQTKNEIKINENQNLNTLSPINTNILNKKPLLIDSNTQTDKKDKEKQNREEFKIKTEQKIIILKDSENEYEKECLKIKEAEINSSSAETGNKFNEKLTELLKFYKDIPSNKDLSSSDCETNIPLNIIPVKSQDVASTSLDNRPDCFENPFTGSPLRIEENDNTELVERPKKNFSDFWTESMDEFYNKSGNQEEFDVNSDINSMPADPSRWKIIDDDKNTFKRPTNRRFCVFCRRDGHVNYDCPKINNK